MKRGARLAAYLIIAGLVAWAVYLLTVGLPFIGVFETVPGEPGLEPWITYMPYQPALYSLFALLVVALGLIRDEWLVLAWMGLALHLIAGVLLIFSLGIVYIAATGVLAVPVGVVQWQASGNRRWLRGAWGGVAILLVVGALMAWNPLGYASLALAGALGVALWVVSRARRAGTTPHGPE